MKTIGSIKKYIATIFAFLFLALALLGVILPGLPTVPFLLLAVWFASRGSQRLHRWIYSHPQLGKLLKEWEEQGAIARKPKVAAIIMLLVSWVIMFYKVENAYLIIGVTLLFVCVAGFILTRPSPKYS